MFILTWLWPQLYCLFCVFSIVNIYKTLNKLSEIAFYNLPLHASRMRVTKRRGRVSHHVTVCVWIHFLGQSGSLVFRFISPFHYPRALQAGVSQRDTWAEWGHSWFKCSLPVMCLTWTSSLRSSLHPFNSPVDLENHLFWRVVCYKKSWSLREIY